MVSAGDDRSVKAGGDIVGSQIITGDHNVAVMKGIKVTRPDPANVAIAEEVAAMKAVLATLGAPDQGKIDRAMADAEEEAAKAEPDKDEIGAAIERAVKYAKGAEALSSHAEKIAPRLAAVVTWLGTKWQSIGAMVGLDV